MLRGGVNVTSSRGWACSRARMRQQAGEFVIHRRIRGMLIGLIAAASLVASPMVAAASTSTSTTTSTSTSPADLGIHDLGDDMRFVAGVDPVADAAATAELSKSARGAAPMNHLVYVSVANVMTANTEGEVSASSLSEANVRAAIQQLSDYWSGETGGAITFSLAGYDTVSYGESQCDPEDIASRQRNRAFDGFFAHDNWVGSNKHLLTLTQETTACNTQAFGTVGGRGGEIFDATGLGTRIGIPVLFHEFGHNLGFGHADVTMCTNGFVDGNISTFAYASTVCPTEEYGDVLDIMGFTVDNSTPHLSAIEKIQFGYFEGSYLNVAGTVPSTTLVSSMNAASGVRALRIADPISGQIYVVEYRTADGLDAVSPDFSGAQSSYINYANGSRLYHYDGSPATGSVRIMREIPFTDKGYAGERNYTETTVLATGLAAGKTNPAFRHPRLDAGESFTSSGRGFTVTVNTANPAVGAEIAITYPGHIVTSTTLVKSKSTQTYGSKKRVALGAHVFAADGTVPAGSVTFFDGSKAVKTVAVKADGSASFTLPATTKAGRHSYSARYAATEFYTASASPAVVAKVKKAKSTTTFSIVKKKISVDSRAKLKVRVKVAGVSRPAGTLVVSVNGKKLKSYKLTAGKKGKLTVTLPKIAKSGTKRITVKYTGSQGIAADTSIRRTLTVVR